MPAAGAFTGCRSAPRCPCRSDRPPAAVVDARIAEAAADAALYRPDEGLGEVGAVVIAGTCGGHLRLFALDPLGDRRRRIDRLRWHPLTRSVGQSRGVTAMVAVSLPPSGRCTCMRSGPSRRGRCRTPRCRSRSPAAGGRRTARLPAGTLPITSAPCEIRAGNTTRLSIRAAARWPKMCRAGARPAAAGISCCRHPPACRPTQLAVDPGGGDARAESGAFERRPAALDRHVLHQHQVGKVAFAQEAAFFHVEQLRRRMRILHHLLAGQLAFVHRSSAATSAYCTSGRPGAPARRASASPGMWRVVGGQHVQHVIGQGSGDCLAVGHFLDRRVAFDQVALGRVVRRAKCRKCTQVSAVICLRLPSARISGPFEQRQLIGGGDVQCAGGCRACVPATLPGGST